MMKREPTPLETASKAAVTRFWPVLRAARKADCVEIQVKTRDGTEITFYDEAGKWRPNDFDVGPNPFDAPFLPAKRGRAKSSESEAA